MKKNFNEWISTFKPSIADWSFYTNFDKVYINVEKIKVELNILNSLIGSKNIESEFINLLESFPTILAAVPILLAKRESEILINDTSDERVFDFYKKNYTTNEFVKFMHKTGLFDLLSNHLISNLVDYVCGVEVGLDSNARKNRTGTSMEKLVEKHLQKHNYKIGEQYYTQLSAMEINKLFGINLDVNQESKNANKRFDFVVKTNDMVYAIEVNFYSGGGSKLNETARSYKMLHEQTKNIPGFKFIWITDGVGWLSAKNNLEETFVAMDTILCINDLDNGALNTVIK